MEINIQSAAQSMPFCRKNLFNDVVHNKVYGDISQVWQLQGHILITTEEGRRLFTFDCKPLHQQHVLDSKCLDISVLSTLLIDVLMLSPHMIALIDTAGNMMIWKFTPEFSWSHEGNVHICTTNGAEIISVTYIPEFNTVVWCERQSVTSPSSVSSSSSTYCICKLQLCSDLNPQKIRETTLSSVFIQDCPPCDVHTMSSNFLFVTTQFNSEQVMLHLAFDFANNQLSLFVGDQCINHILASSHETVDFQDVVMMCLSVLIQMEPGQGDLGVRSDSTMGQSAVLSSGGQLEVYSCVSDSGKAELSKKVIALLYEEEPYKVDTKHWFLHRGHVGIICDNTVLIFRLKDGIHICKSKQGIVKNVQAVVKSTSPIFLTWLLTSEQLFALQGVETRNKEMYTAADKLPEDNHLQTDILRLAHLHELRMHGSTQTLVKDLGHLNKKWTDIKNLSQHSHISNILAPYLDEYWRLETLSHALLDSENQSVIQPRVNSARDIVSKHMESKSFSKTAHHAKLMWLSEIHPKELLDYLCQGITIESDVVPSSEMRKWQSLLGMEGGNLINFECVCRLLFRIMPQKLFNFVKCAESVREHTVGVSAFVRKKQTLMYYKAAWDCLPHSQTSCDSKTAASVKAKLILARQLSGMQTTCLTHLTWTLCNSLIMHGILALRRTDSENCVEGALKCLLQHGLWSEAVELVKEQARSEGLPTYLHITIKTLAEGHVLSDYVTDLFSIMPSWKSLLSFSQLASERPEIRSQQMSNSAEEVFFHGSPDVRLGDVRQLLLNLIEK